MLKPEETSLYSGHWVDGEGPLDADILLVGQAPGETEALRERPFVGPAGRLLQEACALAGIDWEGVRRTNVVRCRPPNNRPPTREEIQEYWPWLEQEIASMPNLRVIVALGNEAAYAFTGKLGGITKRRGVEFEWRGRLVVPTLHPAYVLRDRTKLGILVADLKRARRLVSGGTLEPCTYYRIAEAPNLDPSRPAAVDVEIGDDDQVRLVGFGQSPDRVVITEGIPRVDWDQYLWVGHNIRADELWLGVRLRKEDTMLMAHLLDENSPVGLKDLAMKYLGSSAYWVGVEDALKDPRKRGKIPFQELARYCANDVAATILLYDVLRKDLTGRLETVYRRISLPLSDVLLEMERHGVPIDVAYAEQLEARLAREAAEVEAELQAKVPEAAGLSLRSPDQMAKLLYGRLGLRPHRLTPAKGRGATDERAIQGLLGMHPAVEYVARYRKVEKLRQMVHAWLSRASGGRVRPRYNQAGTVTGRLSGRDPNPQNLPTDPEIRRMVHGEGMAVLAADYSTIELVVAAWIYGVPSILEAYNAGRDLHTETATAILGRPRRTRRSESGLVRLRTSGSCMAKARMVSGSMPKRLGYGLAWRRPPGCTACGTPSIQRLGPAGLGLLGRPKARATWRPPPAAGGAPRS